MTVPVGFAITVRDIDRVPCVASAVGPAQMRIWSQSGPVWW